MSDSPTFSIVSCARNAGPFARRSIESVLMQDDPDWELWFVDDNSDDDTVDRVWDTLKEIGEDERIGFVVNKQRRWKLANFLDFARVATGSIIVELDGDDFFSTPSALSTIRRAYDSSPLVDATAGSFRAHYAPSDPPKPEKIVYAKTQPVAGQRFMMNGFCNSVPAPRTWKRSLTMRSLRDLPELYVDPTTGRPWRTNADIALFAPALFWARDIAAIEEPILFVNWETTAHDDMLEPALMQDEGERLFAWCLKQEYRWSEAQLRVFGPGGDR